MTTATVNPHRSRMLQSLEAGRGYDFLTMAAPYLANCPDDDFTRLMAIREYLKLNLVAPAREVLESGITAIEVSPELAAIRESLDGLADSSIPWSRHTRRFEANLAALKLRGLDVEAICAAWKTAHDQYELFLDANGLDQVRMRDDAGRWRWIPQLGNHRAVEEARDLPKSIDSGLPEPFLFEGLDLGWYFERIYRATQDTFLGFSCALFVVEPDPAVLALVLHLHDWCDILSDQRVFWFVGDSCTEQLRRVWDDNPGLPLPSHAFTQSAFRAGCSPSAVEIVRLAIRKREAVLLESSRDIEKRYAARDVHYWAKRFDEALSGVGAPLRILAAVSSHTTFLQHSVRDAKRAFEALGHECTVLTEKKSYDVVSPLMYHDAIRKFDPDLWFLIDHLRPEFGHAIPTNLPFLAWDQDQLPQVITKMNLAGMGKLDILVGAATGRYINVGCDPKQCLHSLIPTCPEQFGGEPLTEQERKRYECDISYVSHASQTPEDFHRRERAACQEPRILKLLDTMYELVPSMLSGHQVMSGKLARAILDEASRRCGLVLANQDIRDRLTEWYLWRLGDRLFRHEALQWAAEWAGRNGHTFRIYGNGWDKHPSLAAFAAGPAQNGRELICVYRASKINLQLMPAGFLHQRALDGLAAGAFFLTRATGSDQCNPLLARFMDSIQKQGIKRGDEVFERGDDRLRAAFRELLDRLELTESDVEEGFQLLLKQAQLDYPAGLFPGFSDLRFTDYESFAAAASRFVETPALRQSIALNMRQVVLERFTYEATMGCFLKFVSDYFRAASVNPETA